MPRAASHRLAVQDESSRMAQSRCSFSALAALAALQRLLSHGQRGNIEVDAENGAHAPGFVADVDGRRFQQLAVRRHPARAAHGHVQALAARCVLAARIGARGQHAGVAARLAEGEKRP